MRKINQIKAELCGKVKSVLSKLTVKLSNDSHKPTPQQLEILKCMHLEERNELVARQEAEALKCKSPAELRALDLKHYKEETTMYERQRLELTKF